MITIWIPTVIESLTAANDRLEARIAELEGFVFDLYKTCPREGQAYPTGSARRNLEWDFWQLNRKLLNRLEALRGEGEKDER